jgi:hypothetical protein
VGKIAIFLLLICLIVILYISIRNYVNQKRQAERVRGLAVSAKEIGPAKDMAKTYLELPPSMQEWFALNSATALGITVEEFHKVVNMVDPW